MTEHEDFYENLKEEDIFEADTSEEDIYDDETEEEEENRDDCYFSDSDKYTGVYDGCIPIFRKDRQ